MAALAGPPKDRTKTEHVAEVRRVVFENPSGPFVILELADGYTALGPATIEDFEARTQYRFLGRWENDPARGYRFRFSAWVVHAIGSRTGVIKYLVTLCHGIGQKTAVKLWDTYRERAIDTLRDDPARCAAECGIDLVTAQAASAELIEDKRFQNTKVELNGLFAGRGFHGKLIDESIIRWGVRAGEVIRANPFRMLGMSGAGFKRCDKLYTDLGLNPKALKRQVYCLLHAISIDRSGHTWFDSFNLECKLQEYIPDAEPERAFKLAIRAGMLSEYFDDCDRRWLTTRFRAYAEEQIATHTKRLSQARSLWPIARVPVSQVEGDKLPSAHQVEQLARATTGTVGLFCGGPGTGKSHTLAYLIREILAEFGRESVLALAPTGKAAVRMSQSLASAGVELATSTIHSALMKCGAMSRSDHDDDFDGSDRPGKLLSRFLFIDETSMVDANLLAVLLGALPTGSHVLFIGDPHQLPPVGHGSPLRDLIAFGGIPYGELVEVRRNAGQIVHACQRIKAGEPYETSERFDLEATPPANLMHNEARTEDDAVGLLEYTLRNLRSFDPTWQTQVIVARNKGGVVTRKELNTRLQQLLNPDGHTVKPNPFRVGDKIVCLKNCWQTAVQLYADERNAYRPDEFLRDAANYETVYMPTGVSGWDRGVKTTPREVYIANGEIGRVIAVGPKLLIAFFSDGEFAVRIPMGNTRDENDQVDEKDDESGRGCNFDLGYALTCHKLQGSEAPLVIVMADAAGGGVAGREWWYTAISRASRACLTIGQRAAIDKQRQRVATTNRKTFLVERLRALLALSRPQQAPQQPAIQAATTSHVIDNDYSDFI